MNNMGIHKDMGHGLDQKYSKWRRDIFPNIVKRRDCFCTDIDWLEWRKGKPIAVIECRRAIGTLKNCEDVIEHFKKLTNGFQLEVYARIAYELKIRAFIVAIKDNNPDNEEYNNAEFLVEEIIPPRPWPIGRLKNMDLIQLKRIGLFNQEDYAKFISEL